VHVELLALQVRGLAVGQREGAAHVALQRPVLGAQLGQVQRDVRARAAAGEEARLLAGERAALGAGGGVEHVHHGTLRDEDATRLRARGQDVHARGDAVLGDARRGLHGAHDVEVQLAEDHLRLGGAGRLDAQAAAGVLGAGEALDVRRVARGEGIGEQHNGRDARGDHGQEEQAAPDGRLHRTPSSSASQRPVARSTCSMTSRTAPWPPSARAT
jgi:hypothetical protein